MPFTLPATPDVLFTDYTQVADLMGATGLSLRLEDNLGTGSTITGATNATPVVITSAAHGLATADVVQVLAVGGNTGANGLWAVTVLTANTFSLDGSVGNATYTSAGMWFRIDGSSGTISQAVNVATAWVKRYVQGLYDVTDLANSWSVVTWATIKAAHWICARRSNPIPTSLNNLYLEAMDELAQVRAQQMQIEDIGYRNEMFPSWSNLRLDHRWTIKKMRVETVLSGRNRPQYPRKNDVGSTLIGPTEPDTL